MVVFEPHELSVRSTYNKEINLAPEIIKKVFKTKLFIKIP